MIKSFRDKDTEAVGAGKLVPRLGNIAKVAVRKLDQLNAATRLSDLGALPGNRLEALKGKRLGQHSIRINDQYRLCFVWRGGDAYEAEIVDYH